MSSPDAFGILVTSRRTLHLSTEHLIRLQPFGAPDPADPEIAADPGIRILTAHSGTRVDAANAAQFAALHQRLDGLPLALELAGFRLRTLGLDDVLAAAPTAAGGSPRDKPERHRSLDALVASSIADLDDPQRDLLERMSVFAGPVPLEAVVRLTSRVASAVDVRVGVSDLVDRSLVAMSTDGPVRYRLLETVRSHCRARLAEAGRLDEVHDSHRSLVRSTASASLTGGNVVFGLDDLDDDVAAALDRFEHRADDAAEHLGFVMTIATYWYSVNRVGEARTRLRRALALHPNADPISAGTANALLGMISFGEGAFHELASATRKALDLLEPLGFPGLDFVRAGHHVGAGELPRAQAAIEAFLADGTTNGRPLLAGLEVAANSAWLAGDHETAARWFGQQRSAARDQGDRFFEAHALRGEAMMAATLGQPELGVDLCREADGLEISDRQPRVVTERHASAAVVRFALGDMATAAREASAVLDLSTRHFDAHSAALAVPILCAWSFESGDVERVARISGWFDSLCRSLGLYPPKSSADLLADVARRASDAADRDRWIRLSADGATGGLAAALAT
jgi:predicted ATPase